MSSLGRERRILILTDDLGGGTGNHLLSMIKHWEGSCLDIKIVSKTQLTARVASNVPVAFIPPLKRFDFYPFGQICRLIQTSRIVRDFHPDLVHSYFFWSIIYGRILKRFRMTPFLVENREDQGFNWGKHEYLFLRLTRSVPDRVICVSSAVRQVVLKKELLDPNRAVVVHNGVEPHSKSTIDRSAVLRELGISENNLLVGMVSNFNRPVKGVSYLLDAVPSIVRAVPSARFLILGRGKEEKALRDKAKALGVESYVIFGGYREDVGRYYSIFDLSVMTSLSEGLSITLLESMNHGLPVVVTKVGGNPEVVIDGQTGYLVPPRDIPSFVSKVVELLQNPNIRARMGEAGRQRIKQKFNLEDVSARYMDIYDDLLHSSS